MKYISLTLSFMLLLATTAFAGWEDVGTRPISATPTKRVATKSRYNSSSAPKAEYPKAPAKSAYYQNYVPHDEPILEQNERYGTTLGDIYSPYIDALHPTTSWIRGLYVTEANIKETKRAFSSYEIDAALNIFSVQNFLGGDFSLNIDPSMRGFFYDGEIVDRTFLQLPIDFHFMWRYVNAWSFECAASPGIYADFDSLFDTSIFSVPFFGCFYYAFNEATAIRFGAEIRPNWDMTVMPLIGLALEPVDWFRMEIGLPRMMAQFSLGAIDLYGRILWRSATYALDNKEGLPSKFTNEDWQLGAGLKISFSDTFHMTLETGELIGRKQKFSGGATDTEVELEPAPYFGVVFGADF